MREHSFKELVEKLAARELDISLAVQQLNKFKQENIQSDFRFAETYVRSKANKGKGEQRIRAALKEHHVDETFIAKAFEEADVDFDEVARLVYEKKYSGKPVTDWQEKQKRMRFLQYRGFTSQQIQYVLKNADVNR